MRRGDLVGREELGAARLGRFCITCPLGTLRTLSVLELAQFDPGAANDAELLVYTLCGVEEP